MDTSHLKYHPSQVDAFADETGYVGFLTEEQAKTLKVFSAKVQAAHPPAGIREAEWKIEMQEAQGDDGFDYFLCRWLRAREYNIEKALMMLCDHIEWRVKENVSKLRQMSESEVLGCDRAGVLEMCPHWVAGYDSLMRPYIFHQYATLNTATLLEHTTMEHLVRHHIWVQENLSRIVALKSKKAGFVVECWCTVLDLKGMGMRTVTSAFMEMVKSFSTVDQNHYPERNGGVYILNTPSAFPFVWRGIKTLMNPRTTAKINIFSSPKVFAPLLIEILGEANVLEEYGGFAKSDASITAGTRPALETVKLEPDHKIEPESPDYLDPHGGGGGGWTKATYKKLRKRKSKGVKKSSRNGSMSSSASGSLASSMSKSLHSVRSRSVFSGRSSHARSDNETKTFSVASDAFESCVPSMLESGHEEVVHHNETKRRRRRLMSRRRRPKDHRGSSRLDLAIKLTARCFLKLPGAASLLAKDLDALCRVHYILNGFAVVLALCTTAVGLYWMETMVTWTSQLIQAVMWSSLLLVVLGALQMTFSFMGISAVQTRSVGVIVFVLSMELSEVVAHLTLAVSSVIFFANRGPFRNAETAVSGDESRGRQTVKDLNFYCVHLLVVSILNTVMIMFQILLGLLVFRKLKVESSKNRRHRRLGGGGHRHHHHHKHHHSVHQTAMTSTIQQEEKGDIHHRKNNTSNKSLSDQNEGEEMKVMDIEAGNPDLSAMRALNTASDEDEDEENFKSLAGSDASSAGSVDGTTEAELRKILEVSNHITILFALMSIILGGVLLGEGILLIDIISTVAVGPFVMILFGVFLTLAGLLGAYVSNSTQITVLVFYEIFTIMNSCFLLIWAAFCFYQMTRVDHLVDRNWDKLEEQYDDDYEEGSVEQKERADTVSALFKSWLLVTGILETVLAFFQTVNFLAAHALFQVLRRQGIHGVSQWHLLTKNEKITYLWCIFSSIIHIFVDGSYAIFSRHITPREWFLVIWEKVGLVDQRYAEGDSSIVAMESILAIFAGPGCLVFAWAIYTKQAMRHIIGLLVCSTQIYTQILYYAITIQAHYSSSVLFANPAYFFGFIGFQFLRTILPILIFNWCFRKAVKDAEAHEKNKKFFLQAGLERLNLEAELRDQTEDVIDRFFDGAPEPHHHRPLMISQSSLSIGYDDDDRSDFGTLDSGMNDYESGDGFDSGGELVRSPSYPLHHTNTSSSPSHQHIMDTRPPLPPPPPVFAETPPASHSHRRPRSISTPRTGEENNSNIFPPAPQMVRMPKASSSEVSPRPVHYRNFELTDMKKKPKSKIGSPHMKPSPRTTRISSPLSDENDPIGIF